jgi:hypothetical protein
VEIKHISKIISWLSELTNRPWTFELQQDGSATLRSKGTNSTIVLDSLEINNVSVSIGKFLTEQNINTAKLVTLLLKNLKD